MPPFPESPRCLSPFQGNLFSLHCLDFQAEDRITPRWHVGQTCGKASRESHRCLDPREGNVTLLLQLGGKHTCMPTLETRTDSPGRFQKYPKIHVSTGEESSGSCTDSIQGLRPWNRWEKNPERPPSNSHGDWPFLRPPQRVPEVPFVSREHLPELEKIQEVLPFRRDEAHFH